MSNRKVSTDALETLGTIIDDTQKRDAIHLAVEPVIAGELLFPGSHVTMRDGVAMTAREDDGLGIVDPFLTKRVLKGERFWFVMYPRMVTSLRHVWAHPAFPDVDAAVATEAALASSREASEKWLRRFCDTSDCPDYEETLALAVNCSDEYLHVNGHDAHGEIPDEFWDHVEIVTGRKVMHRATFFSCSC